MAIPNKGMKAEAEKGLAWRKEFGRGGTRIGVTRANQIKNGVDLSESTIKRMYSYFSRHEVDKKPKGLDLAKMDFQVMAGLRGRFGEEIQVIHGQKN